MSEKPSGGIFSSIKHNIEQYFEARLHLIQLETIEKIAQVVGLASILFILGALGALFFLCLSLMAGYYFSQVYDNYFIGFAIVAGFYLGVLIIFFITRKRFATFIADQFIATLFNKTILKEEKKPEDAA